ncbi:unannotated protein [freshwater metagenome]|uniref:Unannotated protein n=1 Tax=freshwater metagenome TaxID=449393 RepID=A0A6J7KXR7_9ZZZZ
MRVVPLVREGRLQRQRLLERLAREPHLRPPEIDALQVRDLARLNHRVVGERQVGDRVRLARVVDLRGQRGALAGVRGGERGDRVLDDVRPVQRLRPPVGRPPIADPRVQDRRQVLVDLADPRERSHRGERDLTRGDLRAQLLWDVQDQQPLGHELLRDRQLLGDLPLRPPCCLQPCESAGDRDRVELLPRQVLRQRELETAGPLVDVAHDHRQLFEPGLQRGEVAPLPRDDLERISVPGRRGDEHGLQDAGLAHRPGGAGERLVVAGGSGVESLAQRHRCDGHHPQVGAAARGLLGLLLCRGHQVHVPSNSVVPPGAGRVAGRGSHTPRATAPVPS